MACTGHFVLVPVHFPVSVLNAERSELPAPPGQDKISFCTLCLTMRFTKGWWGGNIIVRKNLHVISYNLCVCVPA